VHVEAGQVVGALAADAEQVEDPAGVDRRTLRFGSSIELTGPTLYRNVSG